MRNKDREQYLLQALRYIVLNPVEAGFVADPAEWPWTRIHPP